MTADELQDYLESLPDKVEQNVADVLQEQARQLSDAQRAALQAQEAAPDETGNLEASCRVETNPDDLLDVHVVAGGDLTTKSYDRGTDYKESVVIDGRNNEGIAKTRKGSGEGVEYDYALGFEFGTSKQPARPFFYSTYRAMKPDLDDAINQTVEKAIND
jgi:HK97 gp10 family phage protein